MLRTDPDAGTTLQGVFMSERKSYTAPELRRLGTVQELTQLAGSPNSDVPAGPSNTAFKPGS